MVKNLTIVAFFIFLRPLSSVACPVYSPANFNLLVSSIGAAACLIAVYTTIRWQTTSMIILLVRWLHHTSVALSDLDCLSDQMKFWKINVHGSNKLDVKITSIILLIQKTKNMQPPNLDLIKYMILSENIKFPWSFIWTLICLHKFSQKWCIINEPWIMSSKNLAQRHRRNMSLKYTVPNHLSILNYVVFRLNYKGL